ncbi:DeoR/GlpR family DNA-binding transcription regulator [Pedococcus sp. 5OH_020]|uniref:DeoR/GlpR family DNA-binding transcription regulator n=1 Tax=Pedococcus sp. 5OH_020 TaxID=2989814 RepID=UPI0022E9A459|nr:DeoR/GlpR family DNA-binding transcription regulator [Pedococcus sp. 5OH_020]
MLASQRRSTILGIVEETGAVKVSELVDQLGVSDMTVRRDIEQLATEGLLERVHGGALAVGGRTSDEPGFTAKSGLMHAEKETIAQAAAALVEPGAAIGISAGTTTYEFARVVRAVPDLTVVTNSVPVAQLLHESGTPGQTVVLTGGIRTPSDALVGPVAVAALRMLHVDRLFLGVHGMDPRAGLTTPNLVEGETNQAMVDSARQVCVLADHTKWGIVGLSTIIPLAQVDTLVTDEGLGTRARRAVAEAGVELVLGCKGRPSPGRNGRGRS